MRSSFLRAISAAFSSRVMPAVLMGVVAADSEDSCTGEERVLDIVDVVCGDRVVVREGTDDFGAIGLRGCVEREG